MASVFRIEQESVNFFDTGIDTLIEGIRYPINNLSLTIPGIALDSVSQHNYIQSQLVPFIDYYSLEYRDALKQELNNAISVERQETERVEKISSFLNGLNENHFFTTSKSYDVNVLENQVVIPIYIIPRTPTQLYEAHCILVHLLVFILGLLEKKLVCISGKTLWCFSLLYVYS